MTVSVIVVGLVPILIGTGAGSEIMSRIAAPMVGGHDHGAASFNVSDSGRLQAHVVLHEQEKKQCRTVTRPDG